MPNALDWSQLVGLDPQIVAQTINFPVHVEPMFSKDNQLISSRNMVSITNAQNELVKLGEVSTLRPLITHTQAVELVSQELSSVGLPFKLRQSIIDRKKFSLYQEYVFNNEIDTPDKEKISPMVILHCDYTRDAPLSVSIGTYRYVCTNGALVGGAGGMVNTRVDAKNWDMVQKVGFANDIKASLDHFVSVSEFYSTLDKIYFGDGLHSLLSAKELPVGFKKQMLLSMEQNGDVTIHVESDKKADFRSKLLTADEFDPEVVDTVVEINGDGTMWSLYNWATDYASHRTTTAYGMMLLSNYIDRAFHSIVA